MLAGLSELKTLAEESLKMHRGPSHLRLHNTNSRLEPHSDLSYPRMHNTDSKFLDLHLLSGVSLTPRGTTEEEGHLTVGDGLLRQIIVDDQSVLPVISEVFTNTTTCDVLEEPLIC